MGLLDRSNKIICSGSFENSPITIKTELLFFPNFTDAVEDSQSDGPVIAITMRISMLNITIVHSVFIIYLRNFFHSAKV